MPRDRVSGVILAGGESKRLNGLYKPLLEVGGRPMILYSLEALRPASDEVMIVVRGREKAESLTKVVGSTAKIVVEPDSAPRAPLIGLMEGARSAEGRTVLVAPADTPFVTQRVYEVLEAELAGGDADAAVPAWPNGYIEPLVAAYRRQEFLRAAEEVVSRGELRISSALSLLRVKLVPVGALSERPEVTFLNVNTLEDLLLALRIVKNLGGTREVPG